MPPGCMDARSSCKSAMVEVTFENAQKGHAIDRIEPRDDAYHRDSSMMLHGSAIIGVFRSYHNNSSSLHICTAESGTREKGVIDGTQRCSGSNNGGCIKVLDQIHHQCIFVYGYEYTTSSLDDDGIGIGRAANRLDFYPPAVLLGCQVRRQGRIK